MRPGSIELITITPVTRVMLVARLLETDSAPAPVVCSPVRESILRDQTHGQFCVHMFLVDDPPQLFSANIKIYFRPLEEKVVVDGKRQPAKRGMIPSFSNSHVSQPRFDKVFRSIVKMKYDARSARRSRSRSGKP